MEWALPPSYAIWCATGRSSVEGIESLWQLDSKGKHMHFPAVRLSWLCCCSCLELALASSVRKITQRLYSVKMSTIVWEQSRKKDKEIQEVSVVQWIIWRYIIYFWYQSNSISDAIWLGLVCDVGLIFSVPFILLLFNIPLRL